MRLLQPFRFVALSMVFLALVSSTVSANQSRKPPKNPDKPLTICVFSPGEIDKAEGEVLDGPEKLLAIVSENVREEVSLEKKWFRVVEEKNESEIQVQIVKQWGWRGTERNDEVGHYNPRAEHGVSRLDKSKRTQDRHFIEANLVMFDQVVETITATSLTENRPAVIFRTQSIKHLLSAADLARRLKDFCSHHYWTLRDLELMLAAWRGDTPEVKTLLGAGADVDAKDDDGVTVLMWAVLSSNAETVGVLLNAGADVTAEANDGSTARMLAPDNSEIAELLKGAGAKE